MILLRLRIVLGLAVFAVLAPQLLRSAPIHLISPPQSAQVAEDGEEEDTPVMLEDMPPIETPEVGTPWTAPNYAGQEGALGYSPQAFAIPPGLEERVRFWIDIYAKYSTDQGVLHDSENVPIVYEAVDFTDIRRNKNLSDREKRKARERRVKEAKTRIRDQLLRLQKVKDPTQLSGEDLRIWKLFEPVSEKDKFVKASKKGRLRFQLGQKDRFIQGIYHSGRYLREMEEIFREEKVPVELTRLPFVESSFNIYARSRVGASGIWQFMRTTARMYMRLGPAFDERNDPIRATRAAARKMRDNFNYLGSWPLAVTGYNHGPNGIKRQVQKLGTTDLNAIIEMEKSRRFGFASSSFYACFLAALEVESKADKYFGKVIRGPEIRGPVFTLERPLAGQQMLQWFGQDQKLAELYNPHLRSHVWKGRMKVPAKAFVRVPQAKVAEVEAFFKSPTSGISLAQNKENESEVTYIVEPGDNLGQIAEQFGVSVRVLRDMNDLNGDRIRAGQRLLIPSK